MRLMVGKIYWFLSLIVCRNMQVGGNAKSHTLNLFWASISCLPVINMPKMNGCELVGVKVTLLKWWLFLVKLLRRNIISFNLLPYFGFWNLANHWQSLKAWNNSLISLRWKDYWVNISLISLASGWLKTCIPLSLNLPKLLYKRLGT